MADELRRAARRQRIRGPVPGRADDDDRPRREADGAAQRPRRLPLLWPLPSRMHHALVLQRVNATLPAAEATGRLTLRPYSIVRHWLSIDRRGKRHGRARHRRRDACSARVPARIVFLCASAIESARILLNSRTSEHPEGLANSSDQVGRNIMDHIKWGGADGEFDGGPTGATSARGPTASTCRDSATSLAPARTSSAAMDSRGSRLAPGWQARCAHPASVSRSSKRSATWAMVDGV